MIKVMEKENQFLEFKEGKTKTYLKTVSAFANYGNGEIRFGVRDDGSILPIENQKDFALDIENQINDTISPQPLYQIVLNPNKTVSLFVEKGVNTPYMFNGKAYIRNDTSTIEVDILHYKRLLREGNNETFDAISCKREDLTFSALEKQLSEKLDIKRVDKNVLKTLGLQSKYGFNNAALLLSDQNTFSGLDIVVFGDNINIFKERHDLSNYSLVKQFEMAIEIFKNHYVEEHITPQGRKQVERIPFIAFREIIVNALIHRTYDVRANTKVEMHENYILISSPGGLLPSINYQQFKIGAFSVLRNPIIASVFNRIGLIDLFATGIKRTLLEYFKYDNKPRFEVIGEGVSVLLPVTIGNYIDTREDEIDFLSLLDSNVLYTREKLEALTGYSKARLIRLLNRLIDKKLIQKIGRGKSTFYSK